MIPKSEAVSLSLVRYLLSAALPNQTDAAQTKKVKAKATKGWLRMYLILVCPWVQDILGNILDIPMTCKSHCDIQFVMNDF